MPEEMWTVRVSESVFSQPLVYSDRVGFVGATNHVFYQSRATGRVAFEYRLSGSPSAGGNVYGPHAYVGTTADVIESINLDSGRRNWQMLVGAAPLYAPVVTDTSVFVTAGRNGMLRIQRENGRLVWKNRDLDRYLAGNEKYLYALDRTGNFHVADVFKGTSLAQCDFSEWILHVSNEWNDRVYLAAHDGSLMCLRHRDNAKPVVTRGAIASPAKEEKKEPKEEKKDEKKEDKKVPKNDDKKDNVNKVGTRAMDPHDTRPVARHRVEQPALLAGLRDRAGLT
jgi:hypothetical protein